MTISMTSTMNLLPQQPTLLQVLMQASSLNQASMTMMINQCAAETTPPK